MSVRYGVSIVVQPSFIAGLHRARQLVCNQYGCWAAEMHMAHLPLIDYLVCTDEQVPRLDAGLEQAVEEFNQDDRMVLLSRRPVAAVADESGHLYVPFEDAGNDLPGLGRRGRSRRGEPAKTVRQLREAVLGVAAGVTGASQTHQAEMLERPVRFDLMRFANLPPRVFQSAANFAAGAVEGVDLPETTFPVEMVLIRLESDAAGDDWSAGGWAADLRWQIVNAYPFRYG